MPLKIDPPQDKPTKPFGGFPFLWRGQSGSIYLRRFNDAARERDAHNYDLLAWDPNHPAAFEAAHTGGYPDKETWELRLPDEEFLKLANRT